jgi:UDP-GlcNAc3NAcA epimerase
VNVLTVVGARPQFIKAGAVSRRLRPAHREVLLHTGQHYDDEMSAQFFRELNLPQPDYELGVGSALHGKQTGRMLEGIEEAILRERPDVVLVYGDTNSTLAGALAAAKLHVPVAHVEAGLRSFNRRMPEEINRVMADHLAAQRFCPSAVAVDNLAREGIVENVHLVGDVMADALADAAALVDASRLARYGVRSGQYALVTVHRAENTDAPERLQAILSALDALDEAVMFPVHPRARAAVERLGYEPPSHVSMIAPVGYLDMIALERHARVVITDSGGVQKEAFWLGVPCVTLRDETEWVETVRCGWNTLAGANTAAIVRAVRGAQAPEEQPPLYPGGAAAAIVRVLAGSDGAH